MLGGLLNTHFGWTSTFYAGAIYGVILLILTMRLPETLKARDLNALKLDHLIHGYWTQFKNLQLIVGGQWLATEIAVFQSAAPRTEVFYIDIE